jgi:hypothetical protein
MIEAPDSVYAASSSPVFPKFVGLFVGAKVSSVSSSRAHKLTHPLHAPHRLSTTWNGRIMVEKSLRPACARFAAARCICLILIHTTES